VPSPHGPATAVHEASHVVAARIVEPDARLVVVRIDKPLDANGDQCFGLTRFERPEYEDDEEQRAAYLRRLVVVLVGYLLDPDAQSFDWPPPWPECQDEEREQVGVLVRRIGLDEAGYRRICQVARELSLDPGFLRAVDLVARALGSVPVLTGEQVEELLTL
jgi:hypothetical protein